ncbi:MAG: GNAT family N-acetyltransferase [Cyanobacteria bacterium J06631_2]
MNLEARDLSRVVHNDYTANYSALKLVSAYNPAPVRTLEELSLNALPCLQQILYDGWILRFADGYTKRANSVTPLYSGAKNPKDLLQKISRCETIYQRLDLKPIFRLTNLPEWSTLDQALSQLGYVSRDTVSVQIKPIKTGDRRNQKLLNSKPLNNTPELTIETELSSEWLDHFVHGANLPIQHWQSLSTMLSIIPNPTCYAYLKERHRFCSCGLGVLENNYLGIFFFVTAKKQRRQGYASQLIHAMTDWGQANGATQVYLQVETANQPGINLYNKLGFTEIYQYFYRCKP